MDADAEVSALKARLENIRARIAEACRRCDRDPSSVRLLPVTKTLPVERLTGALARRIYSKWRFRNAKSVAQP